MIAYVRGICHSVEEDAVVVDVHGVGYRVFVCERDRTDHRPGLDAELLVHTEVREDAILLYGFRSPASRSVFKALLSVPGVGPKGALSLLSALTPAEIAQAVRGEQAGMLTKAKGIGKKLAEVIVVRLRDRLPEGLGEALPHVVPQPVASPLAQDVASALVNLGYRPQAAEVAVAQVQDTATDFNGLLRAALSVLRRPQ